MNRQHLIESMNYLDKDVFMKKVLALTLSAGLTAAVASTSVSAATYLDNVGLYGTATYTRPSNNGLSIGQTANVFPLLTAFYPFNRSLFLAPEFGWDYAIGASYRIGCSDTRVFAEYDHFHTNDNRDVSGLDSILTTPIITGTAITQTTLTSANMMETAHEWRLGFRQFVSVSSRFFVDFTGFFEYNRVNLSVHEFDTLPNNITPLHAYLESNFKFYGWGPGAGFKLIGVPFGSCPTFKLFAGINTTLFYAKNSTDFYSRREQFTGTPPVNITELSVYPENSHSILAKVDIKFGLDYQRMVCFLTGKHPAGISAGVRYMNIFNAFKNGNTSTLHTNQARNNAPTGPFEITQVSGVANDWGRVGPYIQFRLGGCNA